MISNEMSVSTSMLKDLHGMLMDTLSMVSDIPRTSNTDIREIIEHARKLTEKLNEVARFHNEHVVPYIKSYNGPNKFLLLWISRSCDILYDLASVIVGELNADACSTMGIPIEKAFPEDAKDIISSTRRLAARTAFEKAISISVENTIVALENVTSTPTNPIDSIMEFLSKIMADDDEEDDEKEYLLDDDDIF
ncbi:MAG: hypothetical protein BV459_01485 [Thermoplasmata archaeon M11B2D]|nr:MAG: hypothetical protein BV459_01485 [Thermoplasmata archaeon M11B2D]